MQSRRLASVVLAAAGLSLSVAATAAPIASDTVDDKPAATRAVNAKAININTADVSMLEDVKGLGAGKAQAIIDYRSKHGNFAAVSDLENVPGIGPKLLDKIKSQLVVK